jgi:hypothetical protein
MNNLELSNIGGLDESICNAIGIDNNEYSNLINENLLDGLTENTSLLSANGEEEYSYVTITPEQAQQAAQIAKVGIEIGKSLAPKADSAGCKKPALPESFLNRGKWSTYKDCLRDAKAAKQAEAKAEQDRISLERERLAQQQMQQSQQSQQRGSSDDGGDKFLGMPKAVGITVTVVGALALIVGGIFLVKKLRK